MANEKTTVLNAQVKIGTQQVMEEGKVIKEIHYLHVTTDKGTYKMNVGKTTIEEVTKLIKK